MQLFFCTPVALLGFFGQWVTSEAIIGYDGVEHHWHPHRDGFNDRALREHEHRRHDLSHPRLRRMDAHHIHHMLNQKAPIIVDQRNLHITSHSHSRKSFGAGSSSLKTLAKAQGNATEEAIRKHEEAAMHLSRMEKKMMDDVFGDTAEEGVHAAKRVQRFKFRAGEKQSEQHAAEELTAQEVRLERERRMSMARRHRRTTKALRAGGAPAGAAPAGADPAPAPAPMASPAGAPVAPEEKEESPFSMDEDMGAAEQGFAGKIVEHDNMKTMTHDWRGEYGPEYNGVHSYVKICAMYPDNQWCHDRGYHRPTSPPKSASIRPTSSLMFFAAVGLFVFA